MNAEEVHASGFAFAAILGSTTVATADCATDPSCGL